MSNETDFSVTAITTEIHGGFMVTAHFLASGADRTQGLAIVTPKVSVARRLAAAMQDGAVFYGMELDTDVSGATFVSYRSNVRARTANADLKRLGY